MRTDSTRTIVEKLGFLAIIPVLVVGMTACSATQTPATQVDDTTIEAEVKARLAADPETNPFEIDVEVDEAVVQLTGTVDENEDRTAAGRIARDVEGVMDVENELEVGDQTVGEKVDDATITAKVKSKIAADATLNPFNIEVSVEDGVVYLTGRVPTEADSERAHDVAHSVDGVKSVHNKLKVGGQR
ncbi:MAG: BON domain-containing protein [Halobacteriales archaeon]|nr:BON domain-containing protein [Halobacteriales archaeon]